MANSRTAWLIDDQEISNHLTQHILKLNGFSSDFRCFTGGGEALSALEDSVEKGSFPDFIFLDLNMPVLDGWGFLQAYCKFPKEVKEKCTLYILSSSVDEEDVNRSKIYEDVRDFLIKPLDRKDVEVIKFQIMEFSQPSPDNK